MRTLAFTMLLLAGTPAWALDTVDVQRVDAGKVKLSWTGATSVDVFVSETPDATVSASTPVVSDDRDGNEVIAADSATRRYFLVRDRKSGEVMRSAERLLPLDKGSNFRDVGGYPAAGGKHVKWGKIFRSGAMPMLDEDDYTRLEALTIGSVIDLRSIEEREIAPTQLDDRTGALFISNDYSARTMFAGLRDQPKQGTPDGIYVGLGRLVKPQLRAIFSRLLADDGAVVYNCSAGQDRTGIATGLVLTALGVPRDVILKDYHLSTAWRRPQFEMPAVDPAAHPDNPVVRYYADASKKPGGLKAEPLYAKDGEAHLSKFFKGIESEYGSVDAYLEQEMGMTPDRIGRLRALYLE